MAVRQIRVIGDEILNKKCKPVKEMTDRTKDGEQTGYEGCLSVPGKTGVVTRPNHVVVRALDENMNEIEVEGEGLLARAICHECAHLDGQLYTELVEGELMDTENDEEEITEE